MNFILDIYEKEDWLGDFNDSFRGGRWKAEKCFSNNGNVKVYLVVSESAEMVISLKKDIRTLCGIGNHSVHSTDTRDATCELASIAFNQNTIDFMNSSQVSGFPNFLHLSNLYKQYIQLGNINPDKFCIDGSAILAVCNLRDCYDLDFLFDGDQASLANLPERVDCHNCYMIDCGFDKLLDLTISDIITSPDLHFYYKGCKVMVPELICIIKTHRGELKDSRDVKLLAAYIAKKKENENPRRNIVAPDWYSNLDALLREKVVELDLKNISLNTRLYIPHIYQSIIIEWAKNCDLSAFIDDFFYTFEVFQGLNSAEEVYFWDFFKKVLDNVAVKDRTSLLLTARICYRLARTNCLLAPNCDLILMKYLIYKIKDLP